MNGDFPEGWATAPISDVADINPRHPRSVKDSTVVSFAPMAAVSESKPDFNYLEERPLGDVRQGYTHFADGDVLFAKITPCMENGKGAVATGLRNALGCGTTELIVIRPLGAIVPQYVYRFLSQPWVRSKAKVHFTSTAGQARVPTRFIENLEIPLAPVAEQQRIVATLDQLLAKVHESRSRLDHVQCILERFRQSVLIAACSGELTADWRERQDRHSPRDLVQLLEQRQLYWERREVARMKRSRRSPAEGWKRRYKSPFEPQAEAAEDLPKAWTPVTVSQIAFLDVGFAFKSSEFVKNGLRLLRGENLEPGRFRWDDTRHWPTKTAELFEHLLVEEGEIILALDRPLVSAGLKIARATKHDVPCLLVQRMMRFKMVDRSITPWLFYNLQSHRFIDHLLSGMTGSDLPHVTGTGVAEYTFGLPPVAEQKEIIRRIDALFALAESVERRLNDAVDAVAQLMPSLLAKAFRGELVETEAELAAREGREYEDAAMMLVKIGEAQQLEGKGSRMPADSASRRPGRRSRTATTARGPVASR
jgi:type I restriction enzyme, S subunit